MNEDKSTRHRRLSRRLQVLHVLSLVCAVLALALVSGRWPAHGPAWLDDVAALGALALLLCGVSAPWSWAREVALERRFGREPIETRVWARRHVWQWALTAGTALPLWLLFEAAQRVTPWLAVPVTWVAAVLGSLLLLLTSPWLVTWSPRVTPLADEALAGRLHALVGKAGLRMAGVHAWRDNRASEPNAALIGAGPARRLLLSESLLETFAAEDIDVVVAHELGHHACGHLWLRLRMMWAVWLLALLSAQAAALVYAWGQGTLPGDARSLPVVVLAGAVVALGSRPRWLRYSRAHEVEADAFALQMTGRPDVLERILTRLGAHYKAAPEPSPFESAFFLTHPPVRDRVSYARAWHASAVAHDEPLG